MHSQCSRLELTALQRAHDHCCFPYDCREGRIIGLGYLCGDITDYDCQPHDQGAMVRLMETV